MLSTPFSDVNTLAVHTEARFFCAVVAEPIKRICASEIKTFDWRGSHGRSSIRRSMTRHTVNSGDHR
ncbi:hypothetical protein D3OALGA1CA_4834 [Olavius algarvensis associated proteobacterium Delta 3]|nr:hypothetical protein D3OALGB2SA_688 [Olavius algarvensis associated proteobacterium Delta 3]CAB5157633.1 hypothetical protein D3OALGA1CA_4834 [Olavius algarvensis associated proteobacterium Delta 3]